MTLALTPPKPNPFEIACSIVMRLASLLVFRGEGSNRMIDLPKWHFSSGIPGIAVRLYDDIHHY
jgi:hypothetical protein